MEKRIVSMWAAIGFFILLGFQNCAKVAVLDTAPEDPSMAIQGDGTTSVPGGNGQISDPLLPPPPGVGPGGSASLPPSSPGVVDPLPPGVLPPKDPGSSSSMPPVASGDDHHDDSSNPPSQPGAGPSLPPTDPDDPIGDINESDAVALCTAEAGHELKGYGMVSVLSGSSISNVHGPLLLEISLLKDLSNIHGFVIIKGKASNSVVNDISNTRGAMVLCGVSVDEISNTRGSLVLLNSTVKSIDDHRGNIKTMNSEIGSWSNIRGGMIQEIPKK